MQDERSSLYVASYGYFEKYLVHKIIMKNVMSDKY